PSTITGEARGTASPPRRFHLFARDSPQPATVSTASKSRKTRAITFCFAGGQRTLSSRSILRKLAELHRRLLLAHRFGDPTSLPITLTPCARKDSGTTAASSAARCRRDAHASPPGAGRSHQRRGLRFEETD